MLEFIEKTDQQLFLLINGWHSVFFDKLMFLVSDKYTWIPLYLILLYFILRSKKQTWWLSILAIILLVAMADLSSVHLFKDVFMRYRPCHNLDLRELVHTLNGQCGGKYGFVSSHAANTFAIAGFVSLFFKPRWVMLCMLAWAALVSYSRIYLGVHYPADVICGSLLGLLISWFIFTLYQAGCKKFIQQS